MQVKSRFQLSWILCGIYLALMALLCSLGVWQWGRAEKKRQFLDQQQQAMQAPAVNLNISELASVQRYQPVVVQGHFDGQHSFLIDNQIQAGKAGYWVMTPFICAENKRAILVNRGWVALNTDRSQLPDVTVASQAVTIKGRINHFPQPGWVLEGAEIPTENWPAVVQIIKPSVVEQRLGYPVAHVQIELDAEQPHGYSRQWHAPVTIPPEKHRAYAVQWFGLAATLTALFIWLAFKNTREPSA